MRLVIQIPCFNEADTLPKTLADLPFELPGVDEVVIVVIDDGSSDHTAQVALEHGADYVVRHTKNRGLARAFLSGIHTGLQLGADVLVNTDADNQYPGRYISELIAPLLAEEADLVIGDRQPAVNRNFSPLKRILQRLGSWLVRWISSTDAPDAASGFRAYSRFAALRMQVYNSYSYTLETLIQAGRENWRIAHVPISTNPTPRSSRLHRGALDFIWRQSGTILRSYVLYQPLKTFGLLSLPFLFAGAALIGRFLYFYFFFQTGFARYLQSVSIGGTLLIFGVLLLLLGLLGDAVRANRQMLQETLMLLRDRQYSDNHPETFQGHTLIRAPGKRK